jgi:hypothetical protein
MHEWLEGAPLLSRLLRQGGDFDLRELRMPSQVPRPVPAKNAGTRTGQPLDLRFYLERMGQPPAGVGERSHAVGAESHPSKNEGWGTRPHPSKAESEGNCSYRSGEPLRHPKSGAASYPK